MKIKQYLLEPRFVFNRIQLNLLTMVLLWCGMVGGSYWTINKITKTSAVNDTTKEWVFDVATASDYTASNITINDFGAIPAESNNLFSNNSFEEGNDGWSAGAISPNGWVVVPGNTAIGTSDFLVMKWEAKALDTQTSAVVFDGGANSANGWAGANDQTRYQAVSRAEGRPWVRIAQNHGTEFDSIEACRAVNIGLTQAKLIDNKQWMTMARNAEQVASNWTNNQVGNGALVRGSSNSALSLNGGMTLSGINRRTLNLDNGEIVWDMAGNVWNWTNDIQSTAVNTTGAWVEWNHANISIGARELYGPSDVNYLSAQGMGQVYGGALNNAFLRGGGWGLGSVAGVFALNLSGSPAYRTGSIGFRCASDSVDILQSNLSSGGRVSGRANFFENRSFVDGKLTQTINVGGSGVYDLTVFVHNDGEAVDNSIAVIYAAGVTIPETKYINEGNGWWKLSAKVEGANRDVDYGIAIRAGKSIKIDDLYLTKSVNRFANASFENGIKGWNVGAVRGNSTPNGWVVVPGNTAIGTSDFLVMKWEAKALDTGTSTIVTDGGAGSSDGWAGANDQTRYQAVSVSEGRPWVRIAQNHSTEFDAIEACGAVTVGGNSAHLISENEWMTISNNVAEVGANWTGESVGSGVLPRGNSSSSASMDGTNALSGETKRNLAMSNGDEIWDIAGNVWNWTSGTILRKDQPYSWNGSVGSTSWGWNDFDSGSGSTYLKYYKIGSPLQQKNVEPLNLTYAHNASLGLGRIYHYSDESDTSTTNYAFRRGGPWYHGSNAGVFALDLHFSPAFRAYYIGFRCASDSVDILQSYQSINGRVSGGAQKIISPVITDSKVYQTINVGDTAVYQFSVYVYDQTEGNVAGQVDSGIAELFVGGQSIGATYTDAGEGWWKLSARVTGSKTDKEYGVLVKSSKTILLDDFTLNKLSTKTVFTKNAYTNTKVNSWDSFSHEVGGGDNSRIRYQICLDNGSTCEVNIGTTGTTWQYWNGSSWINGENDISKTNNVSDLSEAVMQLLSIDSQKISVKAFMEYEGEDMPNIDSFTIGLTTDITAPSNATNLVMHKEILDETCDFEDNCWTKSASPVFSWNAGSDEENGSGMKGYCLYLGVEPEGNPSNNKGKLGASPVSTANTPCQFIVSSTEIDLSTAGYLASALSNSDVFTTNAPNTYFLNVKAVDMAGNTPVESLSIRFRYDGNSPRNVSYISPASGNFSNVSDMSFSWPISGNASSNDEESGVLGWQYQINSTEGTWRGSLSSEELGLEYIPSGTSTYNLTSRDVVVTGNNVVYFRTVDVAGNPSDNGSIRTGNLSFGGKAPNFSQTDSVTINPDNSEENLFSLSWPEASSEDNNVSKYYYMINTLPPSSLDTLLNNPSTYIDNGNSTTVNERALPNVNKGTNTIYVVAIDDEETPNYSPSNYILGTFTLNSNSPDNVGDLVSSDSSIKSQSQWNVTLTWTAPTYKGAGNLTYQVYRSSDGINFTLIGTSSGLSYVDNAPESQLYYYKIYSKDGANAVSSGTNAVSITPTGKWTSAPLLSSGPDISNVTTRRATITWNTDRNSDSKIQYGTESGRYNDVEPSNSNQVSAHTIQLSGLLPETTYYFKSKWTDEDGNTGISEEKTFKTENTPSVKDVVVGSIGLESATIQFTSNGSSEIKIYYGKTTSFGGLKSLSTATSETNYTIKLDNLDDGSKYYFKINTVDSDGYEYEGTVLDFTTLPRPRISDVSLQEIEGTSQTTVKITWKSNTEISSIVSFYPEGQSELSRDQVDIELTKGDHEMTISGLLAKTNYIVVVKGVDKIGNEARSDSYKLTTATDTRPPVITGIKVEGSTVPAVSSTAQESMAQLIITWTTDEPATSQIEFGEGTGTSYAQRTQEDTNLKINHLVVISNLTPSKVYHLRALSKDAAENLGKSVDVVTITPKATDNALNLVLSNMIQIFGFLGGVFK